MTDYYDQQAKMNEGFAVGEEEKVLIKHFALSGVKGNMYKVDYEKKKPFALAPLNIAKNAIEARDNSKNKPIH